jgi:mono/diheme cytochrome c family protein
MGEKVFRFHCQSCHTVNGFNGIKFAVKGWRKDFLDVQIQNLNQLKGYMPPFLGTDEERHALVEWLYSLNNPPQQTAVRR